MEYLDFELPLKDLKDQLEKCNMLGDESKVDVRDTSKKLKEKIEAKKKEIYSNITPWQRVQLSRHPSRPYTLDYINALTENNFLELHGDRNISDDKAMIGGLGKIDNQTFMFIGQQKGNNIKTRQYRNFGMANPEGYRKALRLMRLAEKFKIPVVTMVDTPGAYPGIEAEERGQAEAIARNLYEMFNLKTQIIVIVIGEGASGGALGIGIGDKIMMLENTWYSVISPESCSSILWRSWDFKEEAANVLKLTPKDMKENKLIDKIIKEPLGGAHQNRDRIFNTVKKEIISTFRALKKQKIKELLENRLKRFTEMGVFNEL
jgi:acetyl-CoA carboxylase carboxyl transferase subunit alpha